MTGSMVVTSLSDSKIILDWISENGGADAGKVNADIASTHKVAFIAAASSYLVPSDKLEGYIIAVETIPGQNGDLATALPDVLYNIKLDDPYNCDLAGGNLGGRSGTIAEKFVPSQPIPVDSEITLEISDAGNSKKGRIVIYVKP